MNFVVSALFILFLLSCSSTVEEKKDTFIVKTDSLLTDPTDEDPPIRRYAEGLEDYTNIEWIEYCLPLPIFEYEETFQSETVKAKHQFTHKGNKGSYIEVQGLARSDKSVSLEEYFKNSYPDDDEAEGQGKIITATRLKENISCFYAQGYWANSIHESRFLEITWLRDDDVVTLNAVYPVADTAKWSGWLVSFLTVNSLCH
ncbi:MAG: hypothetical protein ACHQF2_02615 [Flavobacteriales bacterium]